jgi:magnesium and cobalt transporter
MCSEQIVGEIEMNTITTGGRRHHSGPHWTVPCQSGNRDQRFQRNHGHAILNEEFDTVGGLVISHFGRVPKRGEQVTFDGITFQVLRADSRRLHVLLVESQDQGAMKDDERG